MHKLMTVDESVANENEKESEMYFSLCKPIVNVIYLSGIVYHLELLVRQKS